eukprot:TRINITY_DN2565_c0_g1_i1.p1 TRINITY_DN2565_c0_g1~~TRINITY_DN2565_c0_g1_i1.p1  ORF type:complete len:570 (+),score=138.83 TRINITY_DN2565_c0_g1_i1:179-1711(+)
MLAYMMFLNEDWKISSHFSEKSLLLSLQGLVNREKAKLYFVYPDSWDFTYTQEVFDFYKNFRFYNFTKINNVEEAVRTLAKGVVQGYIIYDPSVRVSIMVAFTLSGLMNGLVIDASYISLMQQLGLPLIMDLRGRFTGMTDAQIYTWAYSTFGEKCNKNLTVWLGGTCGDLLQPGVADYGVQNKAFFSDLNSLPTDPEQYSLAQTILSQLSNFSMVMGWHSYCKDSERSWVKLCSSFGHRVEGLNTVPNLSFSSRVSVTPGFNFTNHHSIVKEHTYVPEKKVYVACVQTDGIGLGSWTKPGRGTMEYSWELEQNFRDQAPAMLEYFYRAMTQKDFLIGALSGPGYMYPKPMTKEMLLGNLKIEKSMMKDLDLNVLELMDYSSMSYTPGGSNNIPKEIVDIYYDALPNAIGFINGYAPSFTFTSRNGVPFLSFDYYLAPSRSERDAIEDLRELAALNPVRPYFLLTHIREFGDVARTKHIVDQLGPDFELIPLDLMMKFAGNTPTFKERYE